LREGDGGYGERMSRDSLDRAVAAAVWVALAGGTVLLVSYFVALPAPLLLAGWLLFLASVLAALTLGVVVSRQEGIGFARAVGRGIRSAFSWVFWFLP
jgi:hypothetical protein